MTLRARTFQIRDGEEAANDEESLAGFLRQVQVERIETAHLPDGWRLLVFYNDTKAAEESAQIASALASSLRLWRRDMSRNLAVPEDDILSDPDLQEVARYAPTTTLELRVVLGVKGEGGTTYENEIVQAVRETLDDLS